MTQTQLAKTRGAAPTPLVPHSPAAWLLALCKALLSALALMGWLFIEAVARPHVRGADTPSH